LLLLVCGAGCQLFPDLSGFAGDAGPEASGNDASPIDASPEADASQPDAGDAAVDAAGDAPDDAPPCTALALVQFAYTHESSSSNIISVNMALAQSAGDFDFVGINYDTAGCGSVVSVADTQGNTYQRIISVDSQGGALGPETWGAADIAPAGATDNTVTATFASACTARNLKVLEYTGVATSSPVDGTLSQHGDGGAPDGSITTSGAAVIVAHTADSSQAAGPGSGWAQEFIDGWGTLGEDRFVFAAGTYSVSYVPAGTEDWVMQAAALRACQ
jgi:hypothetical protein